MSELTEIKESLKDLTEGQSRIEVALGGDDLGTKGLIKNVQDLQKDHYETKAEVKKMKTVWSVLAGIGTLIFAGVGAIIAWFSKN